MILDSVILIDHFNDIDAAIADLAAELRLQYKWKIPDALQAACAVTNNTELATRNSKDFKPKKHGFVLIPYSFN